MAPVITLDDASQYTHNKDRGSFVQVLSQSGIFVNYGSSTLALAQEFARVFDFSLGNLSKFVSLDRLHWFAKGFAVSCK